MQLHFLGTGGFHPNEKRHTACLLLPEIGLMLDAGTSTFRVPAQLQTSTLDIFLTHAHLDHISGLTYLLPPMYDGRIETCRVFANDATIAAVRTHLFAQPVFPIEPAFEYVELTDEIPVGGDGVLTTTRLKHPGGSIGYRVDWPDKSLAYITDTVADGSYADFIDGVDVLIHECYFPDDRAKLAVQTGHSHTTPVVELARDRNVGRLFLVHIDPLNLEDDPIGLDAARAIFPATELAHDGLVIEL